MGTSVARPTVYSMSRDYEEMDIRTEAHQAERYNTNALESGNEGSVLRIQTVVNRDYRVLRVRIHVRAKVREEDLKSGSATLNHCASRRHVRKGPRTWATPTRNR